MADISSNSTFPPHCNHEGASGDRCAGEDSDIIRSSSLMLWMRKLEEMVQFLAEGHTAGPNQSQELKKWLWHVISDLGIHAYLNYGPWELEVVLKVTYPKLLFNAGSLQNSRQTLIQPQLEYFQ